MGECVSHPLSPGTKIELREPHVDRSDARHALAHANKANGAAVQQEKFEKGVANAYFLREGLSSLHCSLSRPQSL